MFKIADFKFFRKQKAILNWRLNLLTVMAKLGGSYNSYYTRIYSFTELFLKKPIRLEVATQFFEARVRFKMPVMPVRVWRVELDLLKSLEFEGIQYFKSPSLDKNEDASVSIYIPDVLTATFQDLERKLKDALALSENKGRIQCSETVGRLTSSGRSFWLDTGVCIKVDTVDMVGVSDYFNRRRLDPKNIKAAILVSDYLENNDFKNFFNESSGLFIQPSSTAYRYVVLERTLNFNEMAVSEGDFLIPMQTVASVDFWSNEQTLAAFDLHHQSCTQFFEQHLVPEFAKLIKNSIEKTFLHFELHQQNITCHLRGGAVKKLMVHDLQDVVFDPISYLLSNHHESWSEAMKFVVQFSRVKFFNMYGEPRVDGPKHKFFFTPGSFYRRYFRNLGNFARLYNNAAGEDYLFSRKFESLIVKELNYSDDDLGLNAAIKASPNYTFLREHLFWVIERRVEAKQKLLMQAQAKVFAQYENEALTSAEFSEVLNRTKSEMCMFSCNLLIRFENLSLLTGVIKKMYFVPIGNSGQIMRSRSNGSLYSIHLNNGERALLLFPR